MPLRLTSSKRFKALPKLRMIAFFTLMLCACSCFEGSDKMVNQTEPQQQFNVEELIQALQIDTLDMKENVVLVKGSIEDINHINNRNTIILKGKTNDSMSILCDMQKDQAILLDSLKIGQVISIKGILKGSLKDIILLNCKISNQPNE